MLILRTAVVSLVVPNASTDVRGVFCCLVKFFASVEAAKAWLALHPGAQVLPVTEAYQVGKEIVRRQWVPVGRRTLKLCRQDVRFVHRPTLVGGRWDHGRSVGSFGAPFLQPESYGKVRRCRKDALRARPIAHRQRHLSDPPVGDLGVTSTTACDGHGWTARRRAALTIVKRHSRSARRSKRSGGTRCVAAGRLRTWFSRSQVVSPPSRPRMRPSRSPTKNLEGRGRFGADWGNTKRIPPRAGAHSFNKGTRRPCLNERIDQTTGVSARFQHLPKAAGIARSSLTMRDPLGHRPPCSFPRFSNIQRCIAPACEALADAVVSLQICWGLLAGMPKQVVR